MQIISRRKPRAVIYNHAVLFDHPYTENIIHADAARTIDPRLAIHQRPSDSRWRRHVARATTVLTSRHFGREEVADFSTGIHVTEAAISMHVDISEQRSVGIGRRRYTQSHAFVVDYCRLGVVARG